MAGADTKPSPKAKVNPPDIIESDPRAALTNGERLDHILRLKQRKPIDGETWYLISKRWMTIWEAACRLRCGTLYSDGFRVINDDVPLENNRLAPHLKVGVELEFVPREAWDLLAEWYMSFFM